jgi:hypothetical protein
MSYSLIKEGLERVKEVTSWEAQLIEYDHKTHPDEFKCYTLNFSSPEFLLDVIKGMCDTYSKIVDSYNGKVLEYTGSNPKHVIDKLSTDSDLIHHSWSSLIQHLTTCDDTTSLNDIKANAFIFIGTYPDGSGGSKNLYMITRQNPILNFKKKSFRERPVLSTKNNIITKSNDPLVQFNKSFDALIYNNVVYMINTNCESIFNMEHSYKVICKKCIDELEQENIIKDIDSFRQHAYAQQTPKKFITYDSNVLAMLKTPKGHQLLTKKFKIPFDRSTKKYDLSEDQNAKNFILLICGKTKNNLLDDGLCEVPSSTPLVLS